MNSGERAEITRWVAANKERVLAGISGALRIPSELDPATVGPGAPFGRGCAAALDHALGVCAEAGMDVANFDGFAGDARFGPAVDDGYVGVLGHLDVVPPGDGWTRDPWGGVVEDGWIWGRGASDDKGPTYAAIFGAIALIETGIGVASPVRLIFGCDEESEWRCMDHYFGAAGQPKPRLGFTPDAGFPLYHAEKGAITATLSREIKMQGIVSVRSGLRPNMVPDSARVQFVAGTEPSKVRRGTGAWVRGEEGWTLEFVGKSAHGAAPRRGINAATKAAGWLRDRTGESEWGALVQLAEVDASGCGLQGSDALTGATTANLGVLSADRGRMEATINIRYPATWNPDSTLEDFRAHVEARGWTVDGMHHTPPLYVPVDAEPVRSLMSVYRRHTGRRGRPKTMGGRTYATTIQPFGVAFGAAMVGDPDVAHRPDERFSVDRMLQCVAIYADAVRTLSTAR